MEWNLPTGGNIHDRVAECLLPDDVPQSLRAIIATGSGDFLCNVVSLAITGEKPIVAFCVHLDKRSGRLSLTTCNTTNNTNQRKTNDFLNLKKIISASTKYFFLGLLVNFCLFAFPTFCTFFCKRRFFPFPSFRKRKPCNTASVDKSL